MIHNRNFKGFKIFFIKARHTILCFWGKGKNFKMDSRYQRYAQHIPKYLVDRPRELLTHCLKKIQHCQFRRFGGDCDDCPWIVFNLSHKCGYKERYTRNLGDENNMLYCTCWNWKSSAYPWKHFFCHFPKIFSLAMECSFLIIQKFTIFNTW